MYDARRLMMRPNWVEGTRMGSPQDIASYYAQITAVDDQVGRLMRTLKELSLDEDTIVVFTSDHGDMLGSQGERLKRKPWEESIRVPGIVRYPQSRLGRVAGGRQTDAMLTHVDFAPTLLSLCGVKPPRAMQGADLSPLILGQSQRGPDGTYDAAYLQIFGPYDGDGTTQAWRGVRTGRYLYARSERQLWLLYDLEKDPFELKNLANDPSAASLRTEMERRLTRWMKRTGDAWRYDWTEKVEDKGRLYSHETFYTVADYLKWARAHPELAPKD
jgi:arylsulfatase A-like enzyme